MHCFFVCQCIFCIRQPQLVPTVPGKFILALLSNFKTSCIGNIAILEALAYANFIKLSNKFSSSSTLTSNKSAKTALSCGDISSLSQPKVVLLS